MIKIKYKTWWDFLLLFGLMFFTFWGVIFFSNLLPWVYIYVKDGGFDFDWVGTLIYSSELGFKLGGLYTLLLWFGRKIPLNR